MTKSQKKFVVESYAKYFGRAPGADEIDYYGLKDNGEAEKASKVLTNIIDDADAEKAELSTSDFVNNAFQNLFGRNATTKEMNKYSKVVDAGKDLPIQSIVKSATKTDKKVYDNKMEVAVKYAELGGTKELDLSKISKGNLVDLNKVDTLTDLTNAIDKLAGNSGIPSSFDGKTFVLTEGVNTGKDFIGTNKDDQFIADATLKITASSADTLDGGKGVDTFKVYDKAGAVNVGLQTLPTLKNIENVVIYDNHDGDRNLTKWDTVETLFLVNNADTATTVATGIKLGEKVTTVNIEDTIATGNPTLTFDNALTAATIGVNKVGTTATPVTVTVASVATAALKTLTINASGKASNVNLTQITTDTIETLNITGKADLTLAYTDATAGATTASKIATIDGSKAEGKLDLNLANTVAATLKTVKTGSGNDTVTVAIAVAPGTTIDLGAGNDKLLAGTGSVLASTATVINGGAGIDSLDAALVNAVNAGVFANFETLSLTAATDLDLALVNKSTISTIEIDGATTSTVRNVSTSQSLSVNYAAVAPTSTTLLFKNVDGKADAYTINFNADNTKDTDAGTVAIAGIETVTVNSVGKTGVANTIALTDADAKSLVITGDKAINVSFDTAFGTGFTGTDGKGVSTIDASTATGAVTINTTAVGVASNGLTIKGGTANDSITLAQKATVNAGAGDDTITTSAVGGTLTGGAGKDTFDVKAAVATGATPTEATAVLTTITDLSAGDKIAFTSVASAFVKTKIALDSTVTNIDLALAAASNNAVAGQITWFQYANNTYIVENVDGTTGIDANDLVVKINGLVDLTNSTYDGATDSITIA